MCCAISLYRTHVFIGLSLKSFAAELILKCFSDYLRFAERLHEALLSSSNQCLYLSWSIWGGGRVIVQKSRSVKSILSTRHPSNEMQWNMHFIPCMNQVLFIFFIEKQESKFDRRLYLIIQVLLSTTMDNRSSRKRLLENESEYFSR